MKAATEMMEAHGAKGTFFINKAAAESQKATLRKLVAAGHELGNGSHDDTPVDGLSNGRQVLGKFNAIRKNVHTIQTPKFYRAPGDAYDELAWAVLNYEGLIPIAPAADIAPGAIIEVKNVGELEELIKKLKDAGLKSVTLHELFSNSTSPRLRAAVAAPAAEVVSGRE